MIDRLIDAECNIFGIFFLIWIFITLLGVSVFTFLLSIIWSLTILQVEFGFIDVTDWFMLYAYTSFVGWVSHIIVLGILKLWQWFQFDNNSLLHLGFRVE